MVSVYLIVKYADESGWNMVSLSSSACDKFVSFKIELLSI